MKRGAGGTGWGLLKGRGGLTILIKLKKRELGFDKRSFERRDRRNCGERLKSNKGVQKKGFRRKVGLFPFCHGRKTTYRGGE